MDFSNNKVLTLEQACIYTGFSKSWMLKLTGGGIVPYSKPNGKSIFFDREKLEAWMLSNAKTSMAEKDIIAASHVTCNPLRSKRRKGATA